MRILFLLLASVICSASALAESSIRLFPIQVGSKWGYVDVQGRMIVEPTLEVAGEFRGNNRIAPFRRNGKWGLIDPQGKILVEPIYEGVGSVYETRPIPVKLDGKWRYIDQLGRTIIEPKFDEALSFSSIGLAAVKVGAKWGYIDIKGETVSIAWAVDQYGGDGFSAGGRKPSHQVFGDWLAGEISTKGRTLGIGKRTSGKTAASTRRASSSENLTALGRASRLSGIARIA